MKFSFLKKHWQTQKSRGEHTKFFKIKDKFVKENYTNVKFVLFLLKVQNFPHSSET